MSHLQRIIICPLCFGLGEHVDQEACLAALQEQVVALELSVWTQQTRVAALRQQIEELWDDVNSLDEAA